MSSDETLGIDHRYASRLLGKRVEQDWRYSIPERVLRERAGVPDDEKMPSVYVRRLADPARLAATRDRVAWKHGVREGLSEEEVRASAAKYLTELLGLVIHSSDIDSLGSDKALELHHRRLLESSEDTASAEDLKAVEIRDQLFEVQADRQRNTLKAVKDTLSTLRQWPVDHYLLQIQNHLAQTGRPDMFNTIGSLRGPLQQLLGLRLS